MATQYVIEHPEEVRLAAVQALSVATTLQALLALLAPHDEDSRPLTAGQLRALLHPPNGEAAQVAEVLGFLSE